jgi:hypothetical protein
MHFDRLTSTAAAKAMKQRRPEEAIVEFLSHSPHARGHGSLPDLSERRWNRVLQWLDDSGLALYFLQKLKDRNAIESVPSWVALQLTTTFTLNQRRSERLAGAVQCHQYTIRTSRHPLYSAEGLLADSKFLPVFRASSPK